MISCRSTAAVRLCVTYWPACYRSETLHALHLGPPCLLLKTCLEFPAANVVNFSASQTLRAVPPADDRERTKHTSRKSNLQANGKDCSLQPVTQCALYTDIKHHVATTPDGQANRQTDRQRDRQTDGRTDGGRGPAYCNERLQIAYRHRQKLRQVRSQLGSSETETRRQYSLTLFHRMDSVPTVCGNKKTPLPNFDIFKTVQQFCTKCLVIINEKICHRQNKFRRPTTLSYHNCLS